MDRWKEEQKREEQKREDQRRESLRRKKIQVPEKVSRKTLCFSNDSWLRRVEKYARYSGGCGASWPDERWKSARRCGAKHISKSKCTKRTMLGPLLEVEMSKKCTPLWREAPCSDHFWKLRCLKSAGRCGAKHISKSKCTKHTMLGPLLEVEMSKKCMLLWREARFQVKMYKTHHARTTFGSWDV